MHHLIYIPSGHLPKDNQTNPLAHVGLADHIACADGKNIDSGPDGKPGKLFAWLGGQSDKRWHYNAEEQDWVPCPPTEELPAGRFYVGTWKHSPPTPDDLKRPGKEPWGEPIELGGHVWLLPPVDLLPRSISLGSDGTPGGRVKPEYRDLVAERDSLVARVLGPRTLVPPLEVAGFLSRCLALNYRLDTTLVLHLGLFDEMNIEHALILALQSRDHYMKQARE